VLECASKAPTLIISPRISPRSDLPVFIAPDLAAWNEFVAKVNHLADSYSCDAASGLRICVRPH
jgi:hypothetical protein